jgi:hypothetical protein
VAEKLSGHRGVRHKLSERLIKGLDPKKTFIVEYINKKGNSQKKIITNGKHSDYNPTILNPVG